MAKKSPKVLESSARQTERQSVEADSPLQARDLQGLKFFKKIRPLLGSLHEIGTSRDKSGNRDLYMDEYCVLVLMWLFNPILTSLRGLQQASTLGDVQEKFGVGRASHGSLSESVRIFDPEPLKQIAATLATEIPSGNPSRFDVIGKQLTAVDGSVFKTAVRVASLAWTPSKGNGKNKGTSVVGYRMHTHFEILRGVPERIDATPATKRTFEMLCFYLLGWASLEELQAHIQKLKLKNA